MLSIPFVPGGTPLHDTLDQTQGLHLTFVRPSHITDWQGIDNWDAYYSQIISKKHRQNNARLRKQLEKQGRLTFSRVQDPADRDRVLCWLIDAKRNWLIRNNDGNDWIPAADYLAFLRRAIREQPDALDLFAMSLDDRLIAAEFSAVNAWLVEALISSYDSEFSKYSPGQLLQEDCLKWAFEKNLPYDFRMGWESYKNTWANRETTSSDHLMAMSLKGTLHLMAHRLPGFAADRVRRRVGRLLPATLKQRLRDILHRKTKNNTSTNGTSSR